MTESNDQKKTRRAGNGPKRKSAVRSEHAGDKPRLTDEQAYAELRRRQRDREGRR